MLDNSGVTGARRRGMAVLLVLSGFLAACAGGAGPAARVRPASPACFVSAPGDIYVRVELCLDAPAPGRFTLAERQAVPDATLSKKCQGRFRREGQRLELQVVSCDHRTVAEQIGQVHTSRQARPQVRAATQGAAGELVLQTSWGQQVTLRRRP